MSVRRPPSCLRRALAGLALMLLAVPALAAPLEVPLPADGELLRSQDTPLATLLLPTGPASGDSVPSRAVEGEIFRRSWRFTGDLSPLQLLAPIRDELEKQGFEEIFACTARACGGFDFRFGIEVIPAPDMVVNLSDYDFYAAEQPKSGTAVSLLVSRSGGATYVQLLERHAPPAPGALSVMPEGRPTNEAAETAQEGGEEAAPELASGVSQSLLADALEKGGALSTGAIADLMVLQGHAPLLDLEFESGSAQMGAGPFDSLQQLARFLRENASATILLVGHTDSVGSLEGNIALSRRRAASVRERLIQGYDIAGARIEVAGAGYMAPLAPNTTQAGRETNRRVEAVLVTP
ncbi:OmpA family protein [Phaeobacter sp. HF9A]|uniref:OmpA family protein n=1 Tax=Phaeobacter sp. HF9A TaxID=2721561 RepID=UPI0014312E93|nr:OmpA family protein [Phaeobacter sp. HF9A]NIZ14969.1 OmpA family protein [Phaeobacter sp. HF9A]